MHTQICTFSRKNFYCLSKLNRKNAKCVSEDVYAVISFFICMHVQSLIKHVERVTLENSFLLVDLVDYEICLCIVK